MAIGADVLLGSVRDVGIDDDFTREVPKNARA
jgi:uncharacterized membrane protein